MDDESTRGKMGLRQTMATAIERDVRRSLSACVRIAMVENGLSGAEGCVDRVCEMAGRDIVARQLAAELIDRIDEIANATLVQAEAQGIVA